MRRGNVTRLQRTQVARCFCQNRTDSTSVTIEATTINYNTSITHTLHFFFALVEKGKRRGGGEGGIEVAVWMLSLFTICFILVCFFLSLCFYFFLRNTSNDVPGDFWTVLLRQRHRLYIEKYQHDIRKTFTHSRVISD